MCVGVAMMFSANSANAATVLNLVDVAPGEEISQSGDDPCVIGDQSCGNNQPAGFDWTTITPSSGSWDLMSPEYTIAELTAALGDGGSVVTVGIDVNVTGNSQEILDYFYVAINGTVEYFFGNEPLAAGDIPGDDLGPALAAAADLANGTGFSDWLLTGIDIAGLADTDTIKFYAGMDDTGGGKEQFFLSNDLGVVPIPAALPLLGTALGVMGLMGWRRRRIATSG